MCCVIIAPEPKPQMFLCLWVKCHRKGKPFVLNRAHCPAHSGNVIGTCEGVLANPMIVYVLAKRENFVATICNDCMFMISKRASQVQIDGGWEIIFGRIAGCFLK